MTHNVEIIKKEMGRLTIFEIQIRSLILFFDKSTFRGIAVTRRSLFRTELDSHPVEIKTEPSNHEWMDLLPGWMRFLTLAKVISFLD